jgi:hypothetical protein
MLVTIDLNGILMAIACELPFGSDEFTAYVIAAVGTSSVANPPTLFRMAHSLKRQDVALPNPCACAPERVDVLWPWRFKKAKSRIMANGSDFITE